MLKTGSTELDKFLNYSNQINCIYGKASTGKTNLCHLIASKHSINKKIIFIDTENSFSPQRIKEFSKNANLNNIFVIKPKSFQEQQQSIENLLNIKNKIDLVIIDSLSMYYRKELQEKNPKTNSMLSKQFNILSELTNHNIPIIITCQVYTDFNNITHPVGGNMVKNWSKCLIQLDKNEKRTLNIEKHPELKPKQLNFTIKTENIIPFNVSKLL